MNQKYANIKPVRTAKSHLMPSADLPLYFEIYETDPNYPAYILSERDGRIHMLCSQYDRSVQLDYDFNEINDWIQAYFPHLKSAYLAWQEAQPTAECESLDVIPAAHYLAQNNRMVIHLGDIDLYGEMEPDHYHLVFGVKLKTPRGKKRSQCEFSLRHVYLIDKALPSLFRNLDFTEEEKEWIKPALEKLKAWLEERHEKPPHPQQTRTTAPHQPLAPLPYTLNHYTSPTGDKVMGILSKKDLKRVLLHTTANPSLTYEQLEDGMDKVWIKDEQGQIYAFMQRDARAYRLGSGGFSVVRPVQNIRTGEWFAAKIQDTDKMSDEKIDVEEYLMGLNNLYHSTIKASEKNLRITIQTWLPGKSVTKLVRPKPNAIYGSTTGDELTLIKANILLSLVQQLKELHDVKYLHRDIKMDNVILDPKTYEVHLVDFGAAERTDSEDKLEVICHEAHPVTTPHYNAPELHEPKLKSKTLYVYNVSTDIFALGRVFGEIFTDLEGFDVEQYLQDILGKNREDYLKPDKYNRFKKYLDYWLARFNPEQEGLLTFDSFFNKDLTLKYPYENAMNHSSLRTIVETKFSKEMKREPKYQIQMLIQQMLSTDPLSRPDANKVIYTLESAIARLSKTMH